MSERASSIAALNGAVSIVCAALATVIAVIAAAFAFVGSGQDAGLFLKKNALHIKGFNNLEKYLLKNIQNEYVLITMGAGDISKFVLSFKDHKKVIKI